MDHRRARPYLITALLTGLLGATEYAVAPPPLGDDANNGRDKPFATVAKALSRAGGGDTIWLARGGLFHETPGEFPAGITMKGGGDPAKPPPLLTSAQLVGGWKPWDKNPKILCTRIEQPVLEVYVDGRFQLLARYPNPGQGWLRTAPGTTIDQILCPDRAKAPKAAAGRWKGAQARWRRWSWWWETRPITGDDGVGALQLGAENRFKTTNTGIGSAFYIDNCLAELDAPGEWFWDATEKLLYLMPPAEADPKTMQVEAGITDQPWKIGAGTTLEGIGFTRCAGNALVLGGKSVVADCLFQDIGVNALRGEWNSFGSVVRGCTFRDVRNIAIQWNENPQAAGGTLIEGNRLERIGMQFGYGGSGSWHAAGMVMINANAITLRRNVIIDTGYAGVILGAPATKVERNIFVRCMGSLNDGAAIYANSSKNRLSENIVLDTVGNLDTSHPWYPFGHGIWMEFLSDFREQVIVDNTVFGSGGNGIFLTNNYQCEVRGNLLCGNRMGQLLLSGREDRTSPQNHVVADNILAGQLPSRRIAYPEHVPANWVRLDQTRGLSIQEGIDFGRMTGTLFILSPGVQTIASDTHEWGDPATWMKELRWADPAPRIARAASLLLINDTDQEQVMTPPGSGWIGTDGKAVGKGVPVKPFRGVIVIREGKETGLPPYICASGIDWRSEPRAPGPAPVAKGKAGKRSEDAEAAKARQAEREAATAKTRSEQTVRATPKPEAWKTWVGRLRTRTAEQVALQRGPAFTSSVFNQQAIIDAIDGDNVTLSMAGSGSMTVNLFSRIKAEDACSIALSLAKGGTAGDHALVAFFARCAGNLDAYGEHIARAGTQAAEVDGSFAAP